nr:TIGR02206 family membrane protein [Streptococcus equi subsp. equi]
YNPSQLKPVLVCRYLATINFVLVLINLATKGNYGFVMDIPIIHTHHLLMNFVIVTMGLTGLIKLIELIYVRFSEANQLELKLSKER